MTYSYDVNLGDTVSVVRWYVQDNQGEATAQLQNEEIAYTLNDEGGSPIRAAINCCRVLAAKYNSPKIQLGGKIEADYTTVRDFYLALAKSLAQKMARTAVAPYAGGISNADKQSLYEDTDRVPAEFTRDMMTEPGTEVDVAVPIWQPGDWW